MRNENIRMARKLTNIILAIYLLASLAGLILTIIFSVNGRIDSLPLQIGYYMMSGLGIVMSLILMFVSKNVFDGLLQMENGIVHISDKVD